MRNGFPWRQRETEPKRGADAEQASGTRCSDIMSCPLEGAVAGRSRASDDDAGPQPATGGPTSNGRQFDPHSNECDFECNVSVA